MLKFYVAKKNGRNSSITTSSRAKPRRNQRSPSVKEEDHSEATRVQPTGAKRKFFEAQSANASVHTSRRIDAVPVPADNDYGHMAGLADAAYSKPPKKKRKVTSEAESHPRTYFQKKSHGLRNSNVTMKMLLAANDGEESDAAGSAVLEEERMVEDALLEPGHHVDYYPKGKSRNDDFDVDPQSDDVDGEVYASGNESAGAGECAGHFVMVFPH